MTFRTHPRSTTGLAILAIGLAWGSAGPFSRAALIAEASVLQVAWSRSVVVALATIALAAFNRTARRDLVRPGLWRMGLILGVANVAIRFAFFSWSLAYISAGFAGILAALTPSLTTIWARHVGLSDRLSGMTKFGLLLGFVGSLALVASGDSGLPEGGNAVIGLLLCLVSIISGAFSSSFSKLNIHRYSALSINSAQFVVGSIVLLPAGLLTTDRLFTPSANIAIPVLGLALVSTLVPFLGSLLILRSATVTNYSIVNYVVPVVAVGLGVLVLQEQLTPGIILAGVLVLVACWLVNRDQQQTRAFVLEANHLTRENWSSPLRADS